LPASLEPNDPDADVRTAEPTVIEPSVLKMPSATAPNEPTVTLVCPHDRTADNVTRSTIMRPVERELV
jgi:hypothetical protein